MKKKRKEKLHWYSKADVKIEIANIL